MADPGVMRRRPWRVEVGEVMADTVTFIRGWEYTRRQVVILAFVCAGGLLAWAMFAIFVGIVVAIFTGGVAE